ncbi:hypothetical protein [Cellulomonas sp. KRMCY2]|uniref:hypothetical protein n=1 Tax=Cellulomonas sp. KRMCY2 TaxID=1304865 RepID=UPI00045EBE77|nr:hypothetical protein [Cellulomonas sp. KRMCY2]
MTQRETILRVLRLATHPLDDDELARRTEISPRQTVNQVCRLLESEGFLARVMGPNGKIVNSLGLAHRHQPATPAPAPAATAAPALPGMSAEQRTAERYMLDTLGERLGLALDPCRLHLDDGLRVEVDGTDVDRTVLVECWAHHGPATSAQKHKLMNDALKLYWIGATLPNDPRLILCLSDAAAVSHLKGGSWQGQALHDLGIDVEVVSLPDAVDGAVIAARARSSR